MLYPQNPTSLPFINTQKDFTVLFREINSEIMHGTIYQLWRPLQYAFCAFFWQCMLELMEDIILSQRQLFPAVSDQLSLQSFFVGCISAFSPRLFRKVAVLCRGKTDSCRVFSLCFCVAGAAFWSAHAWRKGMGQGFCHDSASSLGWLVTSGRLCTRWHCRVISLQTPGLQNYLFILDLYLD